jgi:outer membrane receptor for Fe3+-dicitrate
MNTEKRFFSVPAAVSYLRSIGLEATNWYVRQLIRAGKLAVQPGLRQHHISKDQLDGLLEKSIQRQRGAR